MPNGFATLSDGRRITAPRIALPGTIVYRVLAGSHAWGLAGPDSDADWRGVYIAPTESFLGLGARPEDAIRIEEQTYWELGHFATLCLDGNPNAIESLWIDEALVSESSVAGDALRAERGRFLSAPMVAQYLDWTGAEVARAARSGQPLVGKRASHLVRILIELRVALTTGQMNVRPSGADRDLVMAVRSGAIGSDEIIAMIGRLRSECRVVADSVRWGCPDPAPIEAIVLRARRAALGTA